MKINWKIQKLSKYIYWSRGSTTQNRKLRYWPIMSTNDAILHESSYKSQTILCNLLVQIKYSWFHSKIFIFGQVMVKKWHVWPYLGIRSLANWAENFYGNSGDYYLYIYSSYNAYFHFWFFGPLLAGKWTWPPQAPFMVRCLQTQPSNQNVGPLNGPFKSTAISKSCLRNCQGWPPSPSSFCVSENS